MEAGFGIKLQNALTFILILTQKRPVLVVWNEEKKADLMSDLRVSEITIVEDRNGERYGDVLTVCQENKKECY